MREIWHSQIRLRRQMRVWSSWWAVVSVKREPDRDCRHRDVPLRSLPADPDRV